MTHPVSELTAYLDGALPAADAAAIEAHLAACPACREERDRLASAIALLERLPAPPDASPGFEQRFYARLAAEQAKGGAPRRLLDRVAWRWLGPGFAAAAAAAALVVYTGDRRHRHEDLFLAERLAFAQHLDLLESYEAVQSVGAIEGAEDVLVVEHLDELGEGRP
jgi:anti-sigma factor RsiW